MVLNIFTFSSSEKSQYKKENFWSFPAPKDPLYRKSQVQLYFPPPAGEKEEEEVWLYSGITDQRRPLTLKFSTIFLLEFATKSVNERDRHTHKQREICVCVTLLIEQSQHRRIFCSKLNALDALVEFPTKSISNPWSLGISMNIYH